MNDPILILVTALIIGFIVIATVLYFIEAYSNKKMKNLLAKLEFEKNVIDSAPIMPELAKVESITKNEKIEVMYNDWKERLDAIKHTQIPKISDMLNDAEFTLKQNDYKTNMYKIAKLEMELYKVKTNSDFLLNEIKEITSSEERNRAVITKLKAQYRELYQKFNTTVNDFGVSSKYVALQFENISKRFEDFEDAIENNEFTEIPSIIRAIEEMLKHMNVVVEEVPAIIYMACTLIPNKITELTNNYNKMVKDNYPLDYLNIDYNINEANKKISDILDRLKVLNLEDSLFELKVLDEYFDGAFIDLDKEKINCKAYKESNNIFSKKLDDINSLIGDIFSQMKELKKVYNLSEDEYNNLSDIKEEIYSLNDDYKLLLEHTSNHTFAYSKLVKEIENLALRLSKLEDHLTESLKSIGNMEEDKIRACQQNEEITRLLQESKRYIRKYHFVVMPEEYFTELKEACDAIKEIKNELSKKPITIQVLNQRVDTARDLTVKLFNTAKDLVKTAKCAEMSIVYGNRFRAIYPEIDRFLAMSELCFNRGDFHKSLELSINSLNTIEPGIYDKLFGRYKES